MKKEKEKKKSSVRIEDKKYIIIQKLKKKQ